MGSDLDSLKLLRKKTEAGMLDCRKALHEAPDPEMDCLVAAVASVVKENLAIKRITLMESGEDAHVEAYVHGDGRIGVLVKGLAAAGTVAKPEVMALFHDLALHVAAFAPGFLDKASLPEGYREERKAAILKEVEEDEALAEKPAAIRDGVVEGRLRKHFVEASLLDRCAPRRLL